MCVIDEYVPCLYSSTTTIVTSSRIYGDVLPGKDRIDFKLVTSINTGIFLLQKRYILHVLIVSTLTMEVELQFTTVASGVTQHGSWRQIMFNSYTNAQLLVPLSSTMHWHPFLIHLWIVNLRLSKHRFLLWVFLNIQWIFQKFIAFLLVWRNVQSHKITLCTMGIALHSTHPFKCLHSQYTGETNWSVIWKPTFSYYIHYKACNELVFSFPNGCTVEVWEWISNFNAPVVGHVVTNPCWN